MTVAAVVLAASPDSALADSDGLPRVRRIVDTAWAGGALPIVVVAPDPDGRVARALAGAPVTLAEPAPTGGGPVAQVCRGFDVAAALVSGTSAALIWPARMCWVGAETVTSLLEAHGGDPTSLLRPAYRGESGWPTLLPLPYLDALRSMPPDLMPGDLLAAFVERHAAPDGRFELGDPGTVLDGATVRADLPPYDGPSVPVGDHAHEWGSAAAELPDDAPPTGPTIAPYVAGD